MSRQKRSPIKVTSNLSVEKCHQVGSGALYKLFRQEHSEVSKLGFVLRFADSSELLGSVL
jgi:hypothetical protein